MRHSLVLILCCIAPLAAAEHYGAALPIQAAVPLDSAIRQLDKADRADVVVQAKVDKVCVVKGCWMTLRQSQDGPLTNADDAVRVTFKDYGFFVPSSVIGKNVVVAGALEKVVMTLEETKHYVKDAGGDPNTVTQPRTEYRIVATGLEVKS